MTLNFDGYTNYVCKLYFNNEKSYFTYKRYTQLSDEELKQNEFDDERYAFKINDTTLYYIESNKLNNTIYQLEKGFENEKYYIVKEQIPKINWQITSSTKKIDSYNCIKAIGSYAGRKYTAWFTTEISGFFGPWKLHGLPGIIIQASDDLNEVQFFANRITTIDNFIEENTSTYKEISREEYLKKVNLFVNNLGKKLSAKMPRGFKVRIKSPMIKTIEIYEN